MELGYISACVVYSCSAAMSDINYALLRRQCYIGECLAFVCVLAACEEGFILYTVIHTQYSTALRRPCRS